MTERFVLIADYDGGGMTAIVDNLQVPGQDIVVLLPYFEWALEPVVTLLNELDDATHKVVSPNGGN